MPVARARQIVFDAASQTVSWVLLTVQHRATPTEQPPSWGPLPLHPPYASTTIKHTLVLLLH